FEIGDMPGERRGREPLAVMAHDPRHDDDPPAWRSRRQGEGGAAAATEGRAPLARARAGEALAGMPRPLRGPHHFADEGLGALGATVAVLNAARPNPQFVVTRGHGRASGEVLPGWRLEA